MDVNLQFSYCHEKIVVWINSTLQEGSLNADYEHKNFISRTVWSTVLMLNIAIFIITKICLLKLTLNVSSILQNPHDTLFFIDEMEQLIVTPISTAIIVYDIVNDNGPPFSKVIPNCGIRIVFPLLVSVQFFGGMSIALMRYTAIRYTQIVARYGEVRVMGAILILWQSVLFGNTYLTYISSLDVVKGRCYRESAVKYHPGPIVLLACGTEFAIYFSICHFVYKSDIEVRQFISSDSYRRRKRKNAFNMFGFTIHFLIELIIIVGAMILLQTNIVTSLRVWDQFASTSMTVSKLLLCKPMQKKWIHLPYFLEEKFRPLRLRVFKNTGITSIKPHDNVSMEMKSI